MDDKFVKMESELATVKNQMKQMQKVLAYIASREYILEPLAAMVAALVHLCGNEDVQSGAPSPNDVVRSSGGSETN
ncbi:hypothetical protein DEO72_LG7g1650 [Vigna unguiculata]|uniref:Uncharacterized protein n=1 Tax=Vigna unguiculata TaxID=3917 RepID=A0A4D6MFZ3_VIGUN|nr:hypothetical protein DEO72_LG7g1650 [Vigna unguiculata]